MYLLALVFPPVAVFACGKPFQACLNILFCFMLYFPGAIHAILVVNDYKAKERNAMLIRAMHRQRQEQSEIRRPQPKRIGPPALHPPR